MIILRNTKNMSNQWVAINIHQPTGPMHQSFIRIAKAIGTILIKNNLGKYAHMKEIHRYKFLALQQYLMKA